MTQTSGKTFKVSQSKTFIYETIVFADDANQALEYIKQQTLAPTSASEMIDIEEVDN